VIEEQSLRLRERGPKRINPIFVPSVVINIAPCHIAVLLGIKGPANAPVAACATGAVAIGEATRRLQRGDVDVMIAGGHRVGHDAPSGCCFQPSRSPFDSQR
jgi:3-oxoacyl-[acyl-carrier-protein] synthase II